MKISKFANIIAICFCILLINQFAYSQKTPKAKATVQVTWWTLTAKNFSANAENLVGDYWGTCPVVLKFDWLIVSQESNSVTYQLQRSDGSLPSAITKVDLKYVPNDHMYEANVIDMWNLGAYTPEFKDFKGWINLTTLTPNKWEQKVPFVLQCSTQPRPHGSPRK